MRIAYLVNRYPTTSHSFIRREIHALEAQGLEVLRFSIQAGEGRFAASGSVSLSTVHEGMQAAFGWEDYHLHATHPEVALADRMAVEAAMAFVDLVRQKQLDRLRVCSALDCDDVLIDLSKNGSCLYCSATCFSRVNVAAFRARRR